MSAMRNCGLWLLACAALAGGCSETKVVIVEGDYTLRVHFEDAALATETDRLRIAIFSGDLGNRCGDAEAEGLGIFGQTPRRSAVLSWPPDGPVDLPGVAAGEPATFVGIARDSAGVEIGRGCRALRQAAGEIPSQELDLTIKRVGGDGPDNGQDGDSDGGEAACSDECFEGEVRCDGEQVQDCTFFDADECLEFGQPYDCPPGQRCVGDICQGEAGVCDLCDTPGQLRCASETELLVCEDLGGDGCTEWAPGPSCDAGERCNFGRCEPN